MNAFLWGFTLFSFCFLSIHGVYIALNLWEYTRWLRVWNQSKTQEKRDSQPGPFFSILIPARNEESKIQRCIDSVLSNHYPRFEVIVLDDQSTDLTFEIVNKIPNSKVKAIQGVPLPEGWVGKNWACHQLAEHASGDYLVFTDADTIQQPNNLQYLAFLISRTRAQFLSGFPKQIITSLGEGLTVPYMCFMIFGVLPIKWIPKSKGWFPVAGNGQYMAIDQLFYRKLGGFDKLSFRIVDDFHLPLEVKKAGGRLSYSYLAHTIQTHMYNNYLQAFQGFSKNAFATMGFSCPLMILVIVGLFLYQVSPWLLLGYHISHGRWIIPALVAILSLVNRIMADRMIKIPWVYSFIAPLGYLAILPVLIASIFKRKTGAMWNGRRIHFHKDERA